MEGEGLCGTLTCPAQRTDGTLGRIEPAQWNHRAGRIRQRRSCGHVNWLGGAAEVGGAEGGDQSAGRLGVVLFGA